MEPGKQKEKAPEPVQAIGGTTRREVYLMSDIVWQDPPPDARDNYTPIAQALRARPGEWAKVRTNHHSTSHAANIRRGYVKAFRPAGDFEAVTRRSEHGEGYDTYVRYVGDES